MDSSNSASAATSAGTHRLIREYGAHCITGADDVRELLGLSTVAGANATTGGFTDDATRVRDALSTRSRRDVGGIARRAGMSVDAVAAILGLLALEGAADCDADGWLLRRPDDRR